jgi:hypothetical protein
MNFIKSKQNGATSFRQRDVAPTCHFVYRQKSKLLC